MKERNILLEIVYDGTEFSGWQRQPGQRTIQGTIEEKLSFLCNQSITIAGTGRTDQGVHSLGQCATFSGNFAIPTERIAYALNRLLPSAIFIKRVEEVPAAFHARFSATKKTYRYKIMESRERDPFLRNYYYFLSDSLDIRSMVQGLKYVEGTHDFQCFQASGGQKRESTIRHIYQTELRSFEEEQGRRIEIGITGNGFLYHMVRILVGTLVEIGQNKRRAEEMKTILQGKDRRLAGPTAPPWGLYLEKVYFEEDDALFRK